MSRTHARSLHAEATHTVGHGAVGLWPFLLVDNDAQVLERLGDYRAQMTAAIDAHETLIRGVGGATQKSLDVLQAVAEATREDWMRTFDAGEPASSIRAQFDVCHHRSRELLDRMRSVADEVYECWFAALDAAWASATTAVASTANEDGRAPSNSAATAVPSPLAEMVAETETALQEQGALANAANDGGVRAQRRV